MSTTSTTSSTSGSSSSTTTYQLQNLGSGSAEQITGLASGLNTDQIVQEEMSIYEQPVDNLENQETGLTAQDTALTTIQTALQTLASDAQALGDSSLYAPTQTVTSSDPTLISTTSSTGAGVGGYEVSVTQLANSAQRTFTYASPTTADTMTIDGQSVTVAAGESLSSFVNQINSNSNLDVYAAATSSGTVVLSDRSTGDTGSNFIQMSDSGGTLTEQTALAKEGQNAEFSVDGVSGTSSSNTVTNAIAGVSLTLNGLTGDTPVTVDVSPPAASASNISTAVNTFISQYNTVVSDIETQLSTAPSSSSPGTGTLYDDADLSNLLTQMRSSIYTNGTGLTEGMANLEDIGISTGSTTGTGAESTSALDGDLTLDATQLTAAITSNSAGVQGVLTQWSIQFSSLVGNEADPGGTIDQRIQGNTQQVSDLQNQISAMQASLNDKQTQLVNEFAQMESALSSNQSQASSLTSQIASLPGA